MNVLSKKNISIAIIIFCIILLFSVTSLITLYSDDFYYVSFLQNGLGNFIQNNIDHYINVNGRVLVHLIDEIVLYIGKVAYIPLLILMLLYIFYTSSKIILSFSNSELNHKDNLLYSTCLSMILFLGIDVFVLKETAFWITRSV